MSLVNEMDIVADHVCDNVTQRHLQEDGVDIRKRRYCIPVRLYDFSLSVLIIFRWTWNYWLSFGPFCVDAGWRGSMRQQWRVCGGHVETDSSRRNPTLRIEASYRKRNEQSGSYN